MEILFVLLLIAAVPVATTLRTKKDSTPEEYNWEIDPTKPIYIVKSRFSIRYCHMKGYHLATNYYYPTRLGIKSWESSYAFYKEEQLRFGLKEEMLPSFKKWAEQTYFQGGLYKAWEPPNLTHHCEVYQDREPEPATKVDYILKLVKERYPEHFKN